jgi:hypothetical protein
MRLAELIGTLSLAGETGFGHPDESGLRAAVLAVGLARALGADTSIQTWAYWLPPMSLAGCTADSDLNAKVMGDEIEVHRLMMGVDFGEVSEFLPFLLRTIGREKALPGRLLALALAFARMPQLMDTGHSSRSSTASAGARPGS